jgi:redox-sensitive bicupin YhaK (pirin superfamily)
MINVIKSQDRYHGNFGWLDTYWHFSFDTYYDPANLNWGALRVFNDDVIQPGQGFGMHPHRDMEIVTYVLEGELEHQDNQGNRGVVHPGEVQVMSAGKGIVHSEYNHSKQKPVHLMQLWILPRTKGQKPRWEQHQFTPKERRGRLLPIVSSGEIAGTLKIDQDAQIYVSSLKRGEQVTHQSRADRKAYLFAIDGGLKVNGVTLAKGDQARAADEREFRIQAEKDSELILLDLPEVNGARG